MDARGKWLQPQQIPTVEDKFHIFNGHYLKVCPFVVGIPKDEKPGKAT